MKVAMMLIGLCGTCVVGLAGTNAWIVSTGDWSTPGNWSTTQKPSSSDTVTVNNAGTATISTSGEACYQLSVANAAGRTGAVEMTTGGGLTIGQNMTIGGASGATGRFTQTDGSLTVTGTLAVGASSSGTTGSYVLVGGQLTANAESIGLSSPLSRGYLFQSGGFNSCTGSLGISVGRNTGNGRYELSGGSITSMLFQIGVETGTVGTVLQTGGTNSIGFANNAALTLAYYGNSTGNYVLVSGLLYANPNSLTIGNQGLATLTQSGGVFQVEFPGLTIGSAASSVGTYNLLGGTLFFTNSTRVLTIGLSGQGTLNLGNATGTGLITQNVANVRNLSIATTNATSRGTLHGWGTVAMTGYLINNGRVIADGYGTARTLDLSTFTAASNQLANASSNGWFALNQGRLALPAVLIKSNANALGYSWAEGPSNTVPTLVNGARLSFSNALAGTLTGALLASDRADVPAGLKNVISVWQFSGGTFGTVGLTVRYDDAELTRLGLSDANVHVWQRQGARWVEITQAVNAGNRTVTTTPVTSLGLFAIAADRVTVSTVMLVR